MAWLPDGEDMSTRFNTILERDRHTTDRQTLYRATKTGQIAELNDILQFSTPPSQRHLQGLLGCKLHHRTSQYKYNQPYAVLISEISTVLFLTF